VRGDDEDIYHLGSKLAHLKTQETRKDSGSRKAWKMTLVKRLYELGYSRSDVLNLFKFIDWAMILPEGLKRAFWEELSLYEEERQMPYMTSVEEIGYDRGKREGKEEARSLILLLLNQKLGQLPKRMSDRVRRLSPEQLQALAIALLHFESLDELNVWLENQN
jgi:Domain of unknown function (DUF4351)